MATESGSMDPNLNVDEFYTAIRTKAEAHPDATVITGYILESNGQIVRISTGKNSHVEVNTADILASQKLPAGGTVHFINPKAQVTYSATSTATAANFLTGPLTSAYLGSAGGAPTAESPAHVAGECGQVLTTLACTLAAAQVGAECKQTLWTAGCTFAAAQVGAECKQTLWTAGCTFAAAQVGAECKQTLWTAGCTFAAAQVGAECKQTL
ncbi:MAG: hypothetical protein JWN15_2031, partial [Firmicutes bacterium]|nr:hypothetical protein [Bacillota bacterium]